MLRQIPRGRRLGEVEEGGAGGEDGKERKGSTKKAVWFLNLCVQAPTHDTPVPPRGWKVNP